MVVQEVILASSSAWRRGLLASTGLRVRAVAPGVDEASIVDDDPVNLATARAEAKARAVASRHPDATVLGADQVVHLEGRSFGKPADAADHLAMLRRLQGRVHQLTTAVCLIDARGEESFCVHSHVRVRGDADAAELAAYVASGEAAGCAGGYMVERRGAWLVQHVSGDWNNVIGLPVAAVLDRLRARGWRLPETGIRR
ncbi:MAG: Maf family protein [Myxococcota bacterium]|nr:Maf family protein [Myxococcota bacterium]MEC8423020.1 Maf family protein [Myxococcota bacterium]